MDKDKIKKVEYRVKEVLLEKAETRDDDMKLYAYLISKFYGPYIETMPAKELLTAMYNSKIPHLTSVLRCRQKLQELNRNLRGRKYEERQLRAEKVKEAMITWENDDQGNLF